MQILRVAYLLCLMMAGVIASSVNLTKLLQQLPTCAVSSHPFALKLKLLVLISYRFHVSAKALSTFHQG